MMRRDYYEILGVSKSCTDAEMKSAFRKAAMQCHPDRNPGNTEAEIQFKELNEAYQALSDSQKRAAYDRYGHAAFEHGGFGTGGDGFAASMADIFDDLFGDVMGGRRGGGRKGPARGFGSPLQPGNFARTSVSRQYGIDQPASLGRLRGLRGIRC